MKHAFNIKLSVFSILLCCVCFCGAQTEFKGGTEEIGVNTDDGAQWLKNLGFVVWLDAKSGEIINNGNVQVWANLINNGSVDGNFYRYPNSTQPQRLLSFTTNNFPAVFFSANGTTRLTSSPALANEFAGVNKGFCIMALSCGETNGSSNCLVGFGNSGATNAQADAVIFSPATATVTTLQGSMSVSSNQSMFNRNLTASLSTNIYRFIGMNYDGSGITIIENQRISNSGSYSSAYTRNCDIITLGGWTRQGSFLQPHVGGATMFLLATNSIPGNTWTNVVNYFNNNFYKVY